VGGAHGGVGSVADDDTVPGFGGGSSEVPGLGSGGGGFGGGAGTGSGLMANDRGRQNGPLMSSLLRWMIKGRVADGKSMIALIGRVVAMVQTAGTSDIGGGGGGHDGGGHSAGFGGGGMAQAEPAGADAIE